MSTSTVGPMKLDGTPQFGPTIQFFAIKQIFEPPNLTFSRFQTNSNLEDVSPFYGPPRHIWPKFQSEGGFHACILCHLWIRNSSDWPLVQFLSTCATVAALLFFNLHFLGEVESQLCDLDPEVLSLAVKCLYSLGQRQVIVNINSLPTLIILSRSNISSNDYGKLFVLRIPKLFKLKPSIFLFQILAISRDKATCISFKIKLNKWLQRKLLCFEVSVHWWLSFGEGLFAIFLEWAESGDWS